MGQKVSLLVFFLLYFLFGQGQTANKNYTKGYFRWPLDLKPEIVANLGELRNNHWHMGLDIRSNQKENQQVYAAAAGYIAGIRIEPFGFGRSIFINHPNGLTTVYAHLNDFFPALEQYVTNQQYQRESWALELEFSPKQFPVAKGTFIAFSGNTGGSQGPHLHFEIRDTKTAKCLNPLLFGFPLFDQVPPTIVKLAMYDRRFSVYEQTPQFFAVKKTDTGYIIPKVPVLRTGLNKLSFAIQAYDRINGSNNQDGIYTARLFLDDSLMSGFEVDSVSYQETEYMNAHIDFRYKYNGGPFIQHLSVLPGNHGPAYKEHNSDGTIYLADTSIHFVRVEVTDAYSNRSDLNFNIQYDPMLDKPPVHAEHPHFSPGIVNIFEKKDFEIFLPEYCLYDTIPVLYYTNTKETEESISLEHAFDNPSIPVHKSFTVRLKPLQQPGIGYVKEKVLLRREYGGRTSVRKAEWHNGFFVAEFGDFGNFQAFVDVKPPFISGLANSDTIDLSPASRIVLKATDNFDVENFRAELDGKWLRFTNDKGGSYVYVFDDRCPYGVHELKVTVEDIVGNTTTRTWWFKKYPYTPPKKKPVKKGKSKRKNTSVKKKKAARKK